MSVDGISAKRLVEDPYVRKLVHRKARQRTREKALKGDDVEDIEQDLWVHLIEQSSKYNPNKAVVATFAARVTEHKIVSLIRHRKALRRGGRKRVLSLDADVSDKHGKKVARGSLITADDGLRRLGVHKPSAVEAIDSAQNTERFLSQLPSELRDLVERTLASSITDVARDLGVSRTTIYARLSELRKFIEENKLAEFLRDR
jgi:RNA polymerase sigma factor (sigma-70 family)